VIDQEAASVMLWMSHGEGILKISPSVYPKGSWYSYFDYTCQLHEYFYWVLIVNIDALNPVITDKCAKGKDEWYICTKEELKAVDVLDYDLFNNQGFDFPIRIPTGSYLNSN